MAIRSRMDNPEKGASLGNTKYKTKSKKKTKRKRNMCWTPAYTRQKAKSNKPKKKKTTTHHRQETTNTSFFDSKHIKERTHSFIIIFKYTPRQVINVYI